MKDTKNIKIINEIEEIRKKNNTLWMDILRLALNTKPKETKKILKSINLNDVLISKKIGLIK